MATASLVLQPGTELGGYRILDIVGIGGMAIVYRAEQLTLNRAVALKVLSPELSRDPVFQERFRREGKHVAALEHPNIIPIYDAAESNGRLYLTMRLVDGETLAQRMADGGLSLDRTLAILTPIADALDAAHLASVIHRDVKPQNILLTARDHPFLADFGVAKSSSGQGLTASGSFLGSVSYASPEQIRGEPLTGASDVYSLTAVLYQCLSGEVPYPRDTDASVMLAHLSAPPPALPEAAGPLRAVIARGMAKAPEERYPTAGALLHAAAEALTALPDVSHTAVPAFPAAPRPAAPALVAGKPATPRPVSGAATVAPQYTAADILRPAPKATAAANKRAGRRRLAVAAGALVVAVGGAAAALLLGGSSQKAETAGTANAGPLQVASGRGWTAKPAGAVTFEGLQLDHALALVNPSAPEVGVRVGLLRNAGLQAGELATSTLAGFSAAPKPEPTGIWAMPAYRYRGPMANGGSTQILVAPTTAGQLAVACHVDAPSPEALSACDAAIAGASLRTGRSVAPGPDHALAPGLDSALKPVAARRTADAVAVAALPARAAAARALARTDAAAADALTALHPRTWDADAVKLATAGLTAEARQLTALAAATTARDRARYLRATAAARTAGARLQHGLIALRRRGYAVERAATLRFSTLPKKHRRVHHQASPVTATTTTQNPTPVVSPTVTRHTQTVKPVVKAKPKVKKSPEPPVVVATPQ